MSAGCHNLCPQVVITYECCSVPFSTWNTNSIMCHEGWKWAAKGLFINMMNHTLCLISWGLASNVWEALLISE